MRNWKYIGSIAVFAFLILSPFAAKAVPIISDVDLWFASVDPITGKTGNTLKNPRLFPGGPPQPLWVPSGTTVRMFVDVEFTRGISQPGAALGALTFSADIWDHDDGLFPIPGIDDQIHTSRFVVVPRFSTTGAAKERFPIGPFDFTLLRSDDPVFGKQIFSTPPGAIIESANPLADLEVEDQALADTLEIFAPTISVTDNTTGQLFESASVSYKLSVILAAGQAPPAGALRIPSVPEPSSAGLLLLGLAGISFVNRKRGIELNKANSADAKNRRGCLWRKARFLSKVKGGLMAIRLQYLFILFVILSVPANATQINVVGLTTKDFWRNGDAASKPIWNYQFHSMLTKHLYKDGNPIYQDLEMVFDICYGGGFIDYIQGAGLKGTWSASSSVPANKTAGYDYTFRNTPKKGIAKAWKNDGLNFKWVDTENKLHDGYANGYSEQYIRAFQQDSSLSTKKLHDLAVQKNFVNDKKIIEPGVFASQEGGDKATVNGIPGPQKTLSKHAIIYSGGRRASSRQRVVETLQRTLTSDPFKYNTVTTMIAGGQGLVASPPDIDQSKWKPTTANDLNTQLQKLRAELLKNPQREKALLFFGGHGATAHETRVIKTKDGDPPVPGEGFTFSNVAPDLTMMLDPDKQAWLQQGIFGLGHEDSYELQHIQNPIFNFTTYSENVSGPVGIYLDNLFAGTVTLNGSRGDYILEIADSVLSQIAWSAFSDIALNIRFDFSSDADSFQLSTDFDYFQDVSFSSKFNHYGLGITTILGQGTPIPEPSTWILMMTGLTVIFVFRGNRGRK